MTNSTESLPPPPAYLLDQQKQQQQSSSIKVSETVKALSALKHTPASPNAIRRMQSPQQTSSIQVNLLHGFAGVFIFVSEKLYVFCLFYNLESTNQQYLLMFAYKQHTTPFSSSCVPTTTEQHILLQQ